MVYYNATGSHRYNTFNNVCGSFYDKLIIIFIQQFLFLVLRKIKF